MKRTHPPLQLPRPVALPLASLRATALWGSLAILCGASPGAGWAAGPAAQPSVQGSAPPALQAPAQPAGQPSAKALAALQVLAESANPGSTAASAGAPMATPATPVTTPAASGGRNTIVVQRGQSLDGLIRQHLPQSPLRIELLRDLFKELNPGAFAPGAGWRLAAGAKLQVPNRDDQLRVAFGITAPKPEAQDAQAGAYGAAAAARRGWVRYP